MKNALLALSIIALTALLRAIVFSLSIYAGIYTGGRIAFIDIGAVILLWLPLLEVTVAICGLLPMSPRREKVILAGTFLAPVLIINALLGITDYFQSVNMCQTDISGMNDFFCFTTSAQLITHIPFLYFGTVIIWRYLVRETKGIDY